MRVRHAERRLGCRLDRTLDDSAPTVAVTPPEHVPLGIHRAPPRDNLGGVGYRRGSGRDRGESRHASGAPRSVSR